MRVVLVPSPPASYWVAVYICIKRHAPEASYPMGAIRLAGLRVRMHTQSLLVNHLKLLPYVRPRLRPIVSQRQLLPTSAVMFVSLPSASSVTRRSPRYSEDELTSPDTDSDAAHWRFPAGGIVTSPGATQTRSSPHALIFTPATSEPLAQSPCSHGFGPNLKLAAAFTDAVVSTFEGFPTATTTRPDAFAQCDTIRDLSPTSGIISRVSLRVFSASRAYFLILRRPGRR